MEFLQTEIQRRERSDTFRDTMVSSSESSPNSLENKFSSAMALQATSDSTRNKLSCNSCDRKHPTSKCRDLTKLSINERKSKLRSHNLCYCCLGKGHFTRGCTARCGKCRKRHHRLICASERSQPDSREASTSTEEVMIVSQSGQDGRSADVSTGNTTHVGVACTGEHLTTVLQTAKVKVVGRHGMIETTLLFDSGSDRSYVTSDLVKRVRPEWVSAQPQAYAVFGGNKSSGCKLRDVYKLGLQSTVKCIKGDSATGSLTAVEVPVICKPIRRTEVPCDFLRTFGNLGFADDYGTSRDITIDVLIGQDFYWNFMERGLIRLDGGPVAQETKFGWVVSGSWKGNTAGTHGVNCAHQLVCLNDVPELDFQWIWEIEENGVGLIETGNKCIDPVWQNFQNSVSYIKDEGRYEVSLPWKNEYVASRLLNNEKLAKRRLGALSKRLSRNSELYEAYDKALLDMEQDGIIEEVPTNELCTSNPVFYLPHRPVVSDSILTTKVRPVFDASAKGFNNLSLNDCLEAGPCLLGNLVDILIRFRRWPIAITADITKAFLQIKVRKQDQDVHRFLWTHEGETRVMRFVRVPFGNKSSPFLLNATIKYHLSNYPPSAAKTELEENLYCDDLLTGTDTAKEGYALFKDCDQIMISAGMTFAKFTSNNVKMSEIFFQEFQTKYLDVQSLKILGLKWIAKLDYFSYDGVEVPTDIVVTKRVVLSCIARMFDPLGFLNPFLMTIKIMFQDLWTLGISWDKEIPENYSKRFWEWVAGLKLIQNWHIPRCYVNSE
ncbi:hypothetical protein HOLleu_32800 [Holothuria leucospilota]|uniref:Peptidase aspartic putative domain-containing protein n=1 Tax=Holothuria leucospilota TaxID=206669 RepID=A0A9Q1BJ98_HOLLE|nr:hypothetical protein HOLleu_32800 [Holothuria leucospilota]